MSHSARRRWAALGRAGAVAAAAALALASSPPAAAQTTLPAEESYAYAANAGWITFAPDQEHGVVTGTRFLSGWAYAPNFGWVDLGDGSPANGHAYRQEEGDHGVNHDGAGGLSGFAYAANAGWINFSWTKGNDPQQPRLDLATGLFVGYAYSANLGWILLGTGQLVTTELRRTDTDVDFIDDAEEWRWFGGLGIAGPGTDRDGDGVSDAAEIVAGTSPVDAGDYLRIVSLATDGATTHTLTFTTRPGRFYRIRHAAELGVPAASWADSALGTFPPDAGATTTRTLTFAGGVRRFFRVEAVPPLTP